MKADRTILYLVAVLGVLAIGVAGSVMLEWLRPDVDRGLLLQINGILTPTLAALIVLLRGEDRGAVLGAKLDQNTNLTLATNDKLDRVADSAIAPPRMPTRNLSGEFDR